jgi:hypothetical protein
MTVSGRHTSSSGYTVFPAPHPTCRCIAANERTCDEKVELQIKRVYGFVELCMQVAPRVLWHLYLEDGAGIYQGRQLFVQVVPPPQQTGRFS